LVLGLRLCFVLRTLSFVLGLFLDSVRTKHKVQAPSTRGGRPQDQSPKTQDLL